MKGVANVGVTSEQLIAIEQIVNKYRDFSGAAIPILQEIQNQLGYVSPEFIEKVSELTEIPASELYGIVTFYSQFRLEPIGENHIQICHGTACHLAGANAVIEAFESSTGTKCGSTSKDGKFTLEKVACIGCCSLAPVISVNGKIYGRMTAEKVRKLVRELKGGDSRGQ
ncbi:MAG TPA: NADH-quinone oxidoreductase subunit NuoE [Firmicutes bacterium]|nr:NADH-quinone oxidoreductase subunit NuoE [Bacillota bacterium]